MIILGIFSFILWCSVGIGRRASPAPGTPGTHSVSSIGLRLCLPHAIRVTRASPFLPDAVYVSVSDPTGQVCDRQSLLD